MQILVVEMSITIHSIKALDRAGISAAIIEDKIGLKEEFTI